MTDLQKIAAEIRAWGAAYSNGDRTPDKWADDLDALAAQEPPGMAEIDEAVSSYGAERYEDGRHCCDYSEATENSRKRLLSMIRAIDAAPEAVEVPCPVCGGEAIDKQDRLARIMFAPEAGAVSDCGEAGHAEGRCGNSKCFPLYAAPPAQSGEVEALERDAARWRWLDSRTDHTWEKLAKMSIALTRDYIDNAIKKERALLARREAP